ncbi:BlaR1 family beta-lactam sensor/signal transducer [Sporolactobacillus shoreae]|uniref:BlaR1 family beta-lactam sensor/signal transducer n=1 Tax=Sporolactobacillus shoreae TaxID=1465501 RepID=A0A4Z0GKR4_9BACL|nr:BlaR1 family beta-lactam sensor/signal transducer [Sporolactobacillus shoreae]TGA97469.1 BlaR1 family beta-lactam sensor/signal transducer [Sporolactobacillus shoreae]
MFFIRFMVSSLVSSFIFVIILLMKKLSKNQISARWQYSIWYLGLVALVVPLIPGRFLDFGTLFIWPDVSSESAAHTGPVDLTSSEPGGAAWLQDLATSVNRPNFYSINLFLGFLWIAGMLALMVVALHAGLRLKKIRKTEYNPINQNIILLFEQCKLRLRIKKHLFLRENSFIKSPITFGLFKTYTVLPAQVDKQFSVKELEHIFLHELSHVKHRDILANYLMCTFKLIYWFNPLVWIGFREMKLDREIACDISVLELLDKRGRSEYGYTLLDFAGNYSQPLRFTLKNDIGGSKKQIKKRLERIASFKDESKRLKIKSIAAFFITVLFVVCQFPVLSALAFSGYRYNFSGNNVAYENLSTYFGNYDGCIVLYNLRTDRYDIYNKSQSTLRVSPDSTYKIYSAILGLQQHTITPDDTSITWNHKVFPYDSWNKNQTLSSAMRNSVNWYFQDIDRRVGYKELKSFYNRMSYGNCNLSGGIDSYWLESSLLISPIEQVQALKKFYLNRMNFDIKNVNTVKNAIRVSEKNGVILYGKTGSGIVNGKQINGWFIGYVEKKENTIFFATNIQGKRNATGKKAAEITLSILANKSIY